MVKDKDGEPGAGTPGVRFHISEAVARGAYANSMMVSHTREEFILDFINAFPPQASITTRVITSPGHLKRLIRTLRENLEKFEARHGALPEPPPQAEPAPRPILQMGSRPAPEEPAEAAGGKAQGIRLNLPEWVSRGAYANSVMVSHSREEFVLDFVGTFPPQPTVTARVITSPGHLKRLIRALEENLEKFEARYGPILEVPSPPETPGSQYVM